MALSVGLILAADIVAISHTCTRLTRSTFHFGFLKNAIARFRGAGSSLDPHRI